MRLYQQERAILELTELACEIMDESNVSRAELARRMRKTKGYVSQLLDGRANMTIRTIADIFTALDRSIHFHGDSLRAAAHQPNLVAVFPMPRQDVNQVCWKVAVGSESEGHCERLAG